MTTMKKRTSDFVDEDDIGLLNPNKKQARVGSNRMTETASVVSTLVDMLAKANEVKADEAQAQHKSNELAQQKLELEEKRYVLDKAQREAQFSVERREREAQLKFMQGALEVLKSFSNQRGKTAFRFKGCTDVDLLKEVIHVRPFEAPYGEVRKRWTEVTEHLQRIVGDGITVNATRKRFDDLMTAFHEITMAALRASGTEEEYEEREQLLQDIHDLV
ncbi:hypothetical protein DYB32_010698 [Aphanomyces invadans]|uniref:Uncharacterized protein n=1 Tax=Aphanomyces invadans TaxID=157072 RepID=A0A3R7A175_9STRA|nr:hypothetical protein DYB32_010698 [Aphanomyces invadans]